MSYFWKALQNSFQVTTVFKKLSLKQILKEFKKVFRGIIKLLQCGDEAFFLLSQN